MPAAADGDGTGRKRRRATPATTTRTTTTHDVRGSGCISGGEQEGDEEGPACQSCRKRKSRCSKRQPCAQCQRLNVDCVYDDRRRPGVKAGAVEQLTQRLATLEHLFLGQGLLLQQALRGHHDSIPSSHATPSCDRARNDNEVGSGNERIHKQLHDLRQQYSDAANANANVMPRSSPTSQLPRTTMGSMQPEAKDVGGDLLQPPGLPDSTIDAVVAWYFAHVHRWIPVLHEQRFRSRLQHRAAQNGTQNILSAMISLCLRYVSSPNMPKDAVRSISLRNRYAVVLQSMERFSVDNLQALVIVAFEIIGSGKGPSAWSVIGSMARTIEQLRLNAEPAEDSQPHDNQDHGQDVPTVSDSVPSNYIMRRMTFLKPSSDWTEEEEKRRVFWAVFLLDRFCSVATGWNNSLTSLDVRRRLPCEGAIWQAGSPVKAPFFGTGGRLQPETNATAPSPANASLVLDQGDVDAIGGFAFCVEATESLNLVTSFFLQHAVDFKRAQSMQVWMMRFKELDLRLVRWRLFLPEKWRNASVLNQDGNMDPNLTLAHITHNTAVIQLHQCVAFPSPQLRQCPITLPSTSSAETCVAAATEIATIAAQFLQNARGITNPQFSFCLFIAGRVLLTCAASGPVSLLPAFQTILDSLLEIGQRWNDSSGPTGDGDNPAMRFNKRLHDARLSLGASEASDLDVRRPVYSERFVASRAASVEPGCGTEAQSYPAATPGPTVGQIENDQSSHDNYSPESMSMAFPPLPYPLDHFGAPFSSNGVPVLDNNYFEGEDMVMGQWDRLEHVFDEEFQQMLRVSTFDGIAPTTTGVVAAQYDNGEAGCP